MEKHVGIDVEELATTMSNLMHGKDLEVCACALLLLLITLCKHDSDTDADSEEKFTKLFNAARSMLAKQNLN